MMSPPGPEGDGPVAVPSDRLPAAGQPQRVQPIPSVHSLPAGTANRDPLSRVACVAPLRPIQADDAAALQRFHRRLSVQSIYRRFFQLLPRLSAEQADYFTHLDGVTRHAEVALNPADPAEIIGVARYDRNPGTAEAEYAIIVADAWQRCGVGAALTWQLIAVARTHGLRRFYALVLPENRAMLALFDHLGVPSRRCSAAGVLRVELDLVEQAVI